VKRFWNYKLLGIFKAGYIILKVVFHTVYERISTFFWQFNLASGSNPRLIQRGASIRFPQNVFISKGVSIGRKCQISSEFNDSVLRIGENSAIDKGCLLDFSGDLSIGSNVTISEHVMIETHSHGLFPKSKPLKKPLLIESGVWIGSRVIVLPGVGRIGFNSVVGAGSIVTKSIPDNVVVAGNPAKIIKELK
jgi:acetyltransferase-like isoleucine patch superfamily enzyme